MDGRWPLSYERNGHSHFRRAASAVSMPRPPPPLQRQIIIKPKKKLKKKNEICNEFYRVLPSFTGFFFVVVPRDSLNWVGHRNRRRAAEAHLHTVFGVSFAYRLAAELRRSFRFLSHRILLACT